MQIESEQDSWQPQQQLEVRTQFSMFNKIQVEFSDQKIQQNLERVLEVPNYYFDSTKQCEEQQDDCNIEPPSRDQQAFYDPLQDDDNQIWKKKNFTNKKHREMTYKSLLCPSCLSQVAHSFIKDQQQSKYWVQIPQGILIQEGKIIRNRNSTQIMNITSKLNINTEIAKLINNKISGLQSQQSIDKNLEMQLKQRKQDFNIKVICQCQCGLQIGYFDINQQMFVFINVIE